MSELLPCPFCGTSHFLKEKIEYEWFYLICGQCSCNIYLYIPKGCSIDEIRNIAYRQWNERIYPPEVEKAVERMKPKKVIRRKTYGKKGTDEEYLLFTEYACPTCGIEIPIMDMDTKFCADGCGQALDWSNDE